MEFNGIIIKFKAQNGCLLEIEDYVNLTLLINRNEAFFYRTKNKKICQRIWVFVIWKKSIGQIREKIISYCFKNRSRCYKNFIKKVFHNTETKGEFKNNKITEKTVKPTKNSKNVEEIDISPEKKKKYQTN